VWTDGRLEQAEKAAATASTAPVPGATPATAVSEPTTSVGSTTVR
jgi:hypothetical protein